MEVGVGRVGIGRLRSGSWGGVGEVGVGVRKIGVGGVGVGRLGSWIVTPTPRSPSFSKLPTHTPLHTFRVKLS